VHNTQIFVIIHVLLKYILALQIILDLCIHVILHDICVTTSNNLNIITASYANMQKYINTKIKILFCNAIVYIYIDIYFIELFIRKKSKRYAETNVI
jgi:hypothetical protein